MKDTSKDSIELLLSLYAVALGLLRRGKESAWVQRTVDDGDELRVLVWRNRWLVHSAAASKKERGFCHFATLHSCHLRNRNPCSRACSARLSCHTLLHAMKNDFVRKAEADPTVKTAHHDQHRDVYDAWDHARDRSRCPIDDSPVLVHRHKAGCNAILSTLVGLTSKCQTA